MSDPAAAAPRWAAPPSGATGHGLAALLAALALIAGALIAGTTFWATLAGHVPLPFADHWRFFADADRLRAGTAGLGFLWSPHDDHRIVLPRLFFLLDAWPFGGRGDLLIAVAWMIQIGHGALLVRLLAAATLLGTAGLAGAIGVVAALLFSGLQVENLALGFQIQVVGVLCLATLAIFLMARAAGPDQDPGGGWLGAAAAATAASLTMANGLLVWPVLVLLALWLRVPGRRVAALLIWGVVVWVVCLFDDRSVARHIAAVAESPGRVLTYAACYVGHVADHCAPLGALGIGTAGALLAVGLAARVLFGHPRARPAEAALLAVVTFALASALATALGGLHEPLAQALSSRHATASLIFWAALLFLLWSLGRHWGPRGRWPAGALAAGLMVSVAVAQPRYVRGFAELGELRAIAATALLVQADDVDPLRVAAHLELDELRPLDAALRRLGLSIYGQGRQHWLGRPVGELFAEADPRACLGAANLLAPIDAASFKIGGWAWDTAAGRPVGTILFADGAGRIAGMAAGGLTRHGGLVEPLTPGRAARWAGYARMVPGPFQALALLDGDRRACALADGFHAVAPDHGQGERARDLDVEIDGGWTLGGAGPGSPAIAGGGVAYGSWSGDDARTGKLRLGPIVSRPDRALLIPVLAGPGDDPGRIVLVDVERGREIARLRPAVGFAGRWVGWRVDLPLDPWPPLVAIVAEDRGQTAGDWLAVGWPRWIE